MLQELLDSKLKTGPCVLLVDDDLDVVDVIAEMLMEAGFVVHSASSATQALEILNACADQFNAALIDLGLPDMSGCTLARNIRSRWPNLSIGVLTGRDGEIKTQSWVDLVLKKPIDAASLHKMVLGLSTNSSNRRQAL